MKYTLMTILFVTVFILAGCTGTESGSSVGGVLKSADGGRTFEQRVTIDADQSIARSDVLSIAVNPSNNNIVYIGTMSNDMYVSHDAADSWESITSALLNITNIEIDPFNTQIIYASGMYEGRGSVVQSSDGGNTWERIYVEPKDGTNITAMVVSPINGEMIYIGTSGGTIARTVNAGKSWENLYRASDSVNKLLIDAGDVSTLYALIDGSDIVKSRDDGMTFSSIRDMERDHTLNEELYGGKLYSMAVSPSVSGVIIVGTNKGIFRSNDYGKSWVAVDVIASTIGIPIHAIDINPHNVNQLVYAAAKAVYTSIADGWAITDTTTNRSVVVITHDPVSSAIVYLGLKKVD